MQLRVIHDTVYDYDPPVETAQHMAHLRPRTMSTQQLLSHSLRISPEPASRSEAVDGYGNTRSFFSLQAAHGQLHVVADSVVNTREPLLPAVSLPWEQVRERMRYQRKVAYDGATEFTFPSPYVPRHDEFLDYGRLSFSADCPLIDAASDLMARIYNDFTYEAAATDINTPALDALALRKGVCQDFAHIMIACLRGMGLPARYVSGYLLTQPPPGKPRLIGADASHAWVSVWSPDAIAGGHWVDLDPTNNRTAGEDYVTLAVGRDYSDVSPVRGVIHGGDAHTLNVAVTVAPVAELLLEQAE